MRKTYVTSYHSLTLAADGIRFVNGRFSTDNIRQQRAIESSNKFGNRIWLVTSKEAEMLGEAPEEVPGEALEAEEILEEVSEEDVEEVVVDLPDAEVYACEECGKEFATTKQLNGHLSWHKRTRGE